jgi:hypothetical protein
VFVPEFGYTLSEYDPDRPWVVVNIEHRTVELHAGAEFSAWAREQWPPPRCRVEPDPWQLEQTLWPR